MPADAAALQATPAKPAPRPRAPGLSANAALAFALAYGSLIAFVPWAAVRGEPFFDLAVYIDGFESGAYEYLDRLEGPAYLLSEPLWRYMLEALTAALGDVPATFQAVTLVVSTVYAYVILRTRRSAAIFLCGPLLIDLLAAQVRSAVAGALFFIAYFAGGALLWLVLMVIASLIHTAAIVLFGLFGVAAVLRRLAGTRPFLAKAVAVCCSLVIPLALAALYVDILEAFGDRRVEDASAWPGGVFVLSFGIYYAVMLANLGRVMKHSISILALLIAGLFVTLAAFDVNGLRFLSLTYPALIASAFILPMRQRMLVLTVLFVMTAYHFVRWI